MSPPLSHIKNYLQENYFFKQRVVKAIIVISILLLLLLIQLIKIQVFNHQLYENLAQHNQVQLLPLEAKRGLIYDRHGVLLAENRPSFTLFLLPKKIKNLASTITALQKLLPITTAELQLFYRNMRQQRYLEAVPLKNRLTANEVATIYLHQYQLPPGVVIRTMLIRHYPLGSLMASVLGYVGKINQQELKSGIPVAVNHYIGKIGIEKFYEKVLAGHIGYKVVRVSADGQIGKLLRLIPPVAGENLYLTIDHRLQRIAQTALANERGAVVAIDPNNGEILALVSMPTYDPNLFIHKIDKLSYQQLQAPEFGRPIFNRATMGMFPLASTIKPFLTIQGLETGALTANFTIQDSGQFKLANSKHIYRDWKHGGHGLVDLSKAIMVSCDTFFYTLAMKLGIERIGQILRQFGFGSKTQLDLAEEAAGVIASPAWKLKYRKNNWYNGDTVISGIGQGFMLTTPIQLANAVAALAMRGQRFQPHLLLARQSVNGMLVATTKQPLAGILLSNPSYWHLVITAMQRVISDPHGTAYSRFGQQLNYSVAGKTGGAQLFHHRIVNENPTPENEERLPKHLRNHSLFIVFAPVEKPKIALAVVTENCTIAPQVARRILDAFLNNRYNDSSTSKFELAE